MASGGPRGEMLSMMIIAAFSAVWKQIKKPNFNYLEFGVIEREAGTNKFMMSVGQWIERIKAIGLIVKSGHYGGTMAAEAPQKRKCELASFSLAGSLSQLRLHQYAGR